MGVAMKVGSRRHCRKTPVLTINYFFLISLVFDCSVVGSL